MGKFFLLIGCATIALLFWRASYCDGMNVVVVDSAEQGQKAVLRHLRDERKNCLCTELRVDYTFADRSGFHKPHRAYFLISEKRLLIEPDLGSGWAFGWDNVDVNLIRQVLREGGQFSLFTKYRPNSTNLPRPQPPFQEDPPY